MYIADVYIADAYIADVAESGARASYWVGEILGEARSDNGSDNIGGDVASKTWRWC